MKTKTAELKGDALDYVLAKIHDYNWRYHPWMLENDGFQEWKSAEMSWGRWHGELSKNADVCQKLMDRHKIAVTPQRLSTPVFWIAQALDVDSESRLITAYGSTIAEAVARCVVAMRLGDEVDVPEELAGDAAREVVK